MKKLKLLLIVFIFGAFMSTTEAKNINVYLVHSEKCGYCQNANKFFDSYVKKHSNIKVYKYSVLNEKDSETIGKIEEALHKNTSSIPVIIIGEKFIVGFNDQIQKQIIDIISDYEKNDYYDPLGIVLGVQSKDALNKDLEQDKNNNSISTPTVEDEIHEVEAKEQKENIFTKYTYEIIIGLLMVLLFVLEIFKFKSSK